MSLENQKLNPGLRFASMLADHFIMTFIALVVSIPGFLLTLLNQEFHSIGFFGEYGFLIFYSIGIALYLNKDAFSGRSPGKRFMKLQVVDFKTGQAASPLKCLIRNLTILIWPVEVIFALISPERRLGDKIAGTQIKPVQKPEKAKPNWGQVSVSVLLGLAIASLITFSFSFSKPDWAKEKVPYVKSSYNQEQSERATQLIEAEQSELVKSADFWFYEEVKNDDRKCLYGIIYLNTSEDFANLDESGKLILNRLEPDFPPDEFVYLLRFVLDEPGKTMKLDEKLYDSRIEAF